MCGTSNSSMKGEQSENLMASARSCGYLWCRSEDRRNPGSSAEERRVRTKGKASSRHSSCHPYHVASVIFVRDREVIGCMRLEVSRAKIRSFGDPHGFANEHNASLTLSLSWGRVGSTLTRLGALNSQVTRSVERVERVGGRKWGNRQDGSVGGLKLQFSVGGRNVGGRRGFSVDSMMILRRCGRATLERGGGKSMDGCGARAWDPVPLGGVGEPTPQLQRAKEAPSSLLERLHAR